MATPVTSAAPPGSADQRTPNPAPLPALLGTVCLILGGALTVGIMQLLASFGSDTPHLSRMLALDVNVSSDIGEALGPAGGSVDNLIYVLALMAMGVAACQLMVGGFLHLTPGGAAHPGAARRITVVGLWLSVALTALMLLPLDGTWQEFGTAGLLWASVAPWLMGAAIFGLALMRASSRPWLPAVRAARRG